MQQTTTIQENTSGSVYIKQLCIIGFFFFTFGFVTWVNGTLILYLRIACELEEWQTYLVTFAFFISYTIMALPSSKILQKTGIIKGIQTGLLIMAVGCLLFIPAALLRYYPLFLAGLFVVGGGTTLLQTAVNPYITKLGLPERAAQRISIMGICNKFAGIIGPIVLGALILKDSDGLMAEVNALSVAARKVRLDELARDVIWPYAALTALLILVAFLIKYAHLPEIAPPEIATDLETVTETKSPDKLSRVFLLGFFSIFVSVGVEVIAGDTIANYGIYHGIGLDVAKSLTSHTVFFMLAGYVLGALFVPKLISQEKAFLYSSILGIVLTVVAVVIPGQASVTVISFLGFANALLWPAIWPLALHGLSGKQLSKGSAILIMGICGGAVLPFAYVGLKYLTNNQIAYLLLIPCYLYNIYYFVDRTKAQRSSI